MRGTGHTISRLPAARAAMAGAAILAGASFASAAQAQHTLAGNGEETAYAVSRIAPLGGGVALPRPLAPSQVVLARHIFAKQAKGNLAGADRDIAGLDNPLLLGHLLADRYLGRFHRSTAGELAVWLARYEAQPDALAIHALLTRRLPKGATNPARPALAASLAHTALPLAPPEEIDQAMRALPTDGSRKHALAAFQQAERAQSLFAQNRDAQALEMAGAAFRRGPAAGQVAYAGYIAGLAAWRLQRPALARQYFEDAARAKLASAAVRAAAAFWAARANTITGNPAGFTPWLQHAAQENRTFYGLLAQRTLGQQAGLAWHHESLTEADVAAIAATASGERAFALLQVGETQRAEAELRQLWTESRALPGFERALLLVAREADMIDFAAQLTTLLQGADGQAHDDVRLALPRLAPRGGFRVEAALVYALARLESNFDTAAISRSGARGLMQLMPVTAGYIARDAALPQERLHDPAINLDLGQSYLIYLSEREHISDNLIRLLASYNSGPGRFSRWVADIRDNEDPVLFIESIPQMETRYFVQHVLAYSWIYAARMGKQPPGLNELAAGAFPRFVTRDPARHGASSRN